jgi:hypothetical protein
MEKFFLNREKAEGERLHAESIIFFCRVRIFFFLIELRNLKIN